MRFNIFLALMLCFSCSCLADEPPELSLKKIFLIGKNYPGKMIPLDLSLISSQQHMGADIKLMAYQEYNLNRILLLPISDDMQFRASAMGMPLAKIAFHKKGNIIAATPSNNCQRLNDVYNIYPYMDFPTYVPPNTIRFECRTSLGFIRLRFMCDRMPNCWGPLFVSRPG